MTKKIKLGSHVSTLSGLAALESPVLEIRGERTQRPLRVNLTTLRLFLAVYEEGNIGKAAGRENITASAISKRIQELEADFGIALFNRHAKGVIPTAAAAALARHLRAIFARFQLLKAELSEFARGDRGYIRVHANTSAIVQHISPEIGKFLEIHPLLQVELREDTSPAIVRAVQDGNADFGVFNASTPAPPEIVTVHYRTNRTVVVVPKSHILATCGKVSFEEVLNFPTIALPGETTIQKMIEKVAGELRRPLNVRVRVRSLDAARRMVQDGLGIAILPEGVVRPFADQGHLRIVAIADKWAIQRLSIALRSWEELTAPARLLLEALAPEGPHNLGAGTSRKTKWRT